MSVKVQVIFHQESDWTDYYQLAPHNISHYTKGKINEKDILDISIIGTPYIKSYHEKADEWTPKCWPHRAIITLKQNFEKNYFNLFESYFLQFYNFGVQHINVQRQVHLYVKQFHAIISNWSRKAACDIPDLLCVMYKFYEQYHFCKFCDKYHINNCSEDETQRDFNIFHCIHCRKCIEYELTDECGSILLFDETNKGSYDAKTYLFAENECIECVPKNSYFHKYKLVYYDELDMYDLVLQNENLREKYQNLTSLLYDNICFDYSQKQLETVDEYFKSIVHETEFVDQWKDFIKNLINAKKMEGWYL